MSFNRSMGKDNMVYTHSGILLTKKKNEIISFSATWIDVEIIILSEKRKRQMPYDILYVEYKI